MEKDDVIMTIREAKNYLRVSRETMYKLMRKKDLPVHRIGSRYRFRKSELDKLLDRQT